MHSTLSQQMQRFAAAEATLAKWRRRRSTGVAGISLNHICFEVAHRFTAPCQKLVLFYSPWTHLFSQPSCSTGFACMPLPCCSTLQAASTAQAVPILFVFLSRGLPLERAAACVCREAARPPLLANVLVRDFNIHPKMWRSRHRNRALFFHTFFCRHPKLCDPSAGEQPGRLRTTVSRACG